MSSGIIPYRLEWHPSFGLRAQVNAGERFKVVRIGPDGTFFTIDWKWRTVPTHLDSEFIRSFLERRKP